MRLTLDMLSHPFHIILTLFVTYVAYASSLFQEKTKCFTKWTEKEEKLRIYYGIKSY